MKRQTIVNYIKHSTVPYPTIIERAVKGGWSIENDTTGKDTRTVTLVRGKETQIVICYFINDPTAAFYTCTSEEGAL